jgi:hypothetical protein
MENKKLAFLFLTRGEIISSEAWNLFFSQANPSNYNIYIHPDFNFNPNDKTPFGKHYVKDKKPKEKGYYIDAQKRLIQESVKDQENYKFILCSEDCVPIVNFNFFYDNLTKDSKSSIRYGDSWIEKGQPRYINELKKEDQKANAHWFVLSRKHAEFFSEEEECFNFMNKYICSCEHYPSTALHMKGLLNDENVINKDILLEEFTNYGVIDFSLLKKKEILTKIDEARENGYFLIRRFSNSFDLNLLKL